MGRFYHFLIIDTLILVSSLIDFPHAKENSVDIMWLAFHHVTLCQPRRDQSGQPCIIALHNWWSYKEIYKTSSCTYWQSSCLFFVLCSQWVYLPSSFRDEHPPGAPYSWKKRYMHIVNSGFFILSTNSILTNVQAKSSEFGGQMWRYFAVIFQNMLKNVLKKCLQNISTFDDQIRLILPACVSI